jgi:hypothetical protein
MFISNMFFFKIKVGKIEEDNSSKVKNMMLKAQGIRGR